LTTSWLVDDRWGDEPEKEPGLSLVQFALFVRGGKLQQRWTPLCNISLHALARRVERHHERSSEVLTRDLAVLAEAGDDGERVDTDGGFWLGAMVNANSDGGRRLKIRSVRTWIDADG
jgi:hypothetical protein